MLLLKSSTTVYVRLVHVVSETCEPSLEVTKKEALSYLTFLYQKPVSKDNVGTG